MEYGFNRPTRIFTHKTHTSSCWWKAKILGNRKFYWDHVANLNPRPSTCRVCQGLLWRAVCMGETTPWILEVYPGLPTNNIRVVKTSVGQNTTSFLSMCVYIAVVFHNHEAFHSVCFTNWLFVVQRRHQRLYYYPSVQGILHTEICR